MLKKLQQTNPNNQQVLAMLKIACEALRDWHSLQELMPFLRKYRVFSISDLGKIEELIYSELLKEGAKTNSIGNIWKSLPRYLCQNANLISIYTNHLLLRGDIDTAENLLKQAMRKSFDPKLLELYSNFKSSRPLKQLARAEEWLARDPQNISLFLCLGKICKNQMLWGKAKSYLENSLRIEKTVEAYRELAQIMEKQENTAAALDYYHKALELIKKN